MMCILTRILWKAWKLFRISICFVLLLGSCCGTKPADNEFRKMVSQTKEKYDASQVRDSVMTMFSTNEPNNIKGIPKIPTLIAELPLFASKGSDIDIWTVGNTNGIKRGLAFMTGSGFGHWGIVICPFEDGNEVVKNLHGKVISWEKGVFFFIE